MVDIICMLKYLIHEPCGQYDQIKITKCIKKLHKNDFIRKMNDFDNFTKIA